MCRAAQSTVPGWAQASEWAHRWRRDAGTTWRAGSDSDHCSAVECEPKLGRGMAKAADSCVTRLHKSRVALKKLYKNYPAPGDLDYTRDRSRKR